MRAGVTESVTFATGRVTSIQKASARTARRPPRAPKIIPASPSVADAPAVEARAGRQDEARREAHDVARKQAQASLAPARADERGCAPRRVDGLVARAAHLSCLEARGQGVARADGARPLERNPDALRGHALESRQRLAVAVCGDGREALVEDLRARVSAEREVARARRAPIPAR